MVQIISVDELEVRLDEEDVRVLDVREDNEFALGHIRGAMNLPLSGFPEIMSRLDWHLKYYVIDASGDRSDRACKYLDEAGHHVTKVDGGMDAWEGEVK